MFYNVVEICYLKSDFDMLSADAYALKIVLELHPFVIKLGHPVEYLFTNFKEYNSLRRKVYLPHCLWLISLEERALDK